MWTMGNRIPGVFQSPRSNKLLIVNYINGNWNYYYLTENLTEDWFNLKIQQKKIFKVFKYMILINGKEVFSVINTTPIVWNNVRAEFGRIRDRSEYEIVVGAYRNLQVSSKW